MAKAKTGPIARHRIEYGEIVQGKHIAHVFEAGEAVTGISAKALNELVAAGAVEVVKDNAKEPAPMPKAKASPLLPEL
jgi:hypothetical protein